MGALVPSGGPPDECLFTKASCCPLLSVANSVLRVRVSPMTGAGEGRGLVPAPLPTGVFGVGPPFDGSGLSFLYLL